MSSLDAPVKAAIFDIGATLVTGPPVAPNKAIAGLLSGVTAAEVASVIMTTPFECADDVCRALAARFGAIGDEARESIAELWNAQACAPREIDGASETVLALKRGGIKIGLLSDIWSPYYAGVGRALESLVSTSTSAREPSTTC